MQKDNLEILLEDIRGKFDLVLEGHDVLRKEILDSKSELHDEIDLVSIKIEALNNKIDGIETRLSKKIEGVAADLKAHRSDTEVHKKVYKVKET